LFVNTVTFAGGASNLTRQACFPFQARSLRFASFFAPHQPSRRWRGGSPIDRRLYEPSPIGPSSALSLGLDDAPRHRLGLASFIRGRRAQRKRHRIYEQEYLACRSASRICATGSAPSSTRRQRSRPVR